MEYIKFKTKWLDDMEVFARNYTDGLTEGFKPGSPYSDIPFTNRIVDGITNKISPSVIPSVKVNTSPLCRPSPPLFLLLLPHPNSPLPNCKQPPPLKISPSS
jgi:hypothetical protein